MSATGAAKRVFEILDREPAIKNFGGQTLESVRGQLNFEKIQFAYPSRPESKVLKSFHLPSPGEVVALVGPSGSGKTTIANLICRFYDPNVGTVKLDQHSLTDLQGDWLRQQIGVVSQDPVLMSATIADNIKYGKKQASADEVKAAATSANAHEFIDGFSDKYETLVGERGFSSCQRQRV